MSNKAKAAPVAPLRYGGGLVPPNHPAANPVVGLQIELRRSAHNIAALEQRLAAMTGNELVWGPVRSEQKLSLTPGGDSYETEVSAAQVNLYVGMYVKERAHYAHLAKIAIDYDLDRRRLAVSEQTVDALYRAVRVGIQSVGLSDSDVNRVLSSASVELQRTVEVESVPVADAY